MEYTLPFWSSQSILLKKSTRKQVIRTATKGSTSGQIELTMWQSYGPQEPMGYPDPRWNWPFVGRGCETHRKRDKSKVYAAVEGVIGCYCAFYNLFNYVRRRKARKAREHVLHVYEMEKQMHLDSISRLADTILMPALFSSLRSRVVEKLDLSKEQDMETLKYLSFTRMVVSAWAMTMVSLYTRVQLKVMGRNVYSYDRDILNGDKPHDTEIKVTDACQYFGTGDFLILILPSLIRDMKAATSKVFERKEVAGILDRTELLHIIKDIMKTFAPATTPRRWLNYVLIQEKNFIDLFRFKKIKHSDISIFRRLIKETRVILLSDKFAAVLDTLLNNIAEAVTTELMSQETNNGFSGVSLHELIPKVCDIGLTLVDKYNDNKFAQLIRNAYKAEVLL